MIMKKQILDFREIGKKDIPTAGGKGANLGEMFSNFPIPGGFVVTVLAYTGFLMENGLEKEIDGILSSIKVNDTTALDRGSERIRKLILRAKMSRELGEEIKGKLRQLKSRLFAVRSSATAEDLPEASFAGQQDTYLNVKKEKVTESVKKCWASLYTSRAIFYRRENRIGKGVGMAVVVQEMVPSEISGVVFTVDPVRKKDILVEATHGLGERLVSGQVTPNTYFVDRKTFGIRERHINEKIDDRLVVEIAKMALRIEKHYGKPQDIEFAFYRKKPYILQARPITTL
jgi:pyruvate,water dikinase